MEILLSNNPYGTGTQEWFELDTLVDEGPKLVVYNDDVNTFDHVIQTLIEVCGHTHMQAEQCTYIIHFKGKCTVKEGNYDQLISMRQAICDRGISAEVE